MVEIGHVATILAILGPMAAFFVPEVTLSAILGSVTIIFGSVVTLSAILESVMTLFWPVVILSAILGLVTSVLANLGGVGTILAGSNIVMYFH